MSNKEEAIRSLMDEFINSFNDEERSQIDFFPGLENEDHYAWSFLLGRNKITWKYNYKTKKIEKESYDVVDYINSKNYRVGEPLK